MYRSNPSLINPQRRLCLPFVTPNLAVLIATVMLGFQGIAGAPDVPQASFTTSRPHSFELLYTDSGNAIHGGAIVKVNAVSGERTIFSIGGNLTLPFGLTVTPDGRIIVTDCGRVIEIDTNTGEQSVLYDLGWAAGLAIDRDGNLLIAGGHTIFRLDLVSGLIVAVATGGHLTCALAVAESPNGALLVLNAGSIPSIIRISKGTGRQEVVAQGGFLQSPQSLVVHGQSIYVTDVATSDGNFGIGCILRINAQNGKQTEIARGRYLVAPVGIALDHEGYLVVGDPYTVNPDSFDLYDGAIVRINLATGDQHLICRGSGELVNPRGLAFLPTRLDTQIQQ